MVRPVSTTSFAYESRAMEAGDFDRDGDIDLVGASATGTIIVLENRGNFLEAPNAHRTEYPSPTPAGPSASTPAAAMTWES